MRKYLTSALLMGSLLMAACGGGKPATTESKPADTKPVPVVDVEAPDAGEEKAVRAAFESLYKAVQAGDKSHYGTFLVYRGADAQRAWKDVVDVSHPDEKLEADKFWAQLTMLFQGASACKVSKYFTEQESEGTWHVLVVDVQRDGGSESSSFAFLKVKGAYAVGDID